MGLFVLVCRRPTITHEESVYDLAIDEDSYLVSVEANYFFFL